jgi:hypothetical protein
MKKGEPNSPQSKIKSLSVIAAAFSTLTPFTIGPV